MTAPRTLDGLPYFDHSVAIGRAFVSLSSLKPSKAALRITSFCDSLSRLRRSASKARFERVLPIAAVADAST